MGPGRRSRKLAFGETDGTRNAADASSGRSSTSRNDHFFGTGFFQQFAADRIQPRSTERTRRQAVNMRTIDPKHAVNEGKCTHQVDGAGWHHDTNDDKSTLDAVDFNRDVPIHIRDPRTYSKSINLNYIHL